VDSAPAPDGMIRGSQRWATNSSMALFLLAKGRWQSKKTVSGRARRRTMAT